MNGISMDIRTMIIILSVLTSCSVLVMIFIHKLHFSEKGSLYWACGSFVSACSFVLLSLRGVLPDFITIVFANTATFYGLGIIYSGMRVFTGRTSKLKTALTIPLIFPPFLCWYSHVEPLFLVRTILVTSTYGVYSGFIAWELLKDVKSVHLKAQCFLGYVFIGNVICSLTGVILSMIYKPSGVFLESGSVTIGLYLYALIFVFLFTAGIIMMISERLQVQQKQGQVALLKSENQLRTINDIIFTHDINGYFIAVNPSLCNVYGYEEHKLIGRHLSDFMVPEFIPVFAKEYLEPLKRYGRLEGTTICCKKNGEKFYLEYKSVLVRSEDGELTISGVGRDITEKVLSEKKVVKLQEQITQSQKMESIGTLAGGIAHDFNNILFPILGYTEMLMHDIPDGGSEHNKLEKIYSGAMRARDLVKQILTFSRQGTNELQLIKIQPILKEALMLLRSTIPTTIDITQDITSNCGLVKADPTQIHQIIINLSTNSYHAMEKSKGELKVSLKDIQLDKSNLKTPDMIPGDYACLTVSDTGMGMDKELIEKIFDPFFTTKEQGKGTGMGLSVVHGIVTGMGGIILVDSEPGKGSEFNIYFPVENSSCEEQSVQLKEVIQGGNEQILLVDDEEAILTMERHILERLGYQVTSRTSSLEALEAFRVKPYKFDLVISDLAMPNMPGDKLAVELIKIRPDIPILLCTGFSETVHEERAVSIGIKDFLMKPIATTDLSKKVRRHLDNN